LLALEGTAPHAGASLIQARANFFAHTDAYPVSQVLVAEREGAVIGVECLALAGVLGARSVRHLLVPLPAESAACPMLRPFAADLVDFNFVVKRLGDSPPVPPGPLYFDIRH